MSAPSASTVTQPRSAAAKAAQGRGRASLRHRPASSSSSPRSTTSCAPCRATTTMRTRTSARLPEDVAGSSKRTIDGGTRHLCRNPTIHRPCSACSLPEVVQQVMTSYSVVSDGDTHKVPASRVERAGGGDGCEDIRWDGCARPSAVRVTGGARSFSVHHFFRIVELPELE